jgi:hypothetical protein
MLLLRAVLVLVAASSALPTHAEELLVLRDGRRIPVTQLARRDGQVLLETTRGERFAVPEADVVDPPLAAILLAPGPDGTPPLVTLKDGRRIPVQRLARRDGQVLLETTAGERFAVAEAQVTGPDLATIPFAPGAVVAGPTAPAAEAPQVPAPETPAAPPPAPAVDAPAAPVAPPVPASQPPFGGGPLRTPLPSLSPLGYAGAVTIAALTEPREEEVPMPDRWRLGFPRFERYEPQPKGMPWVEGSALDPYNQNRLKGDYPIAGNDTFLVLNLQSATNLNPRRVAAGGAQKQLFLNQNLVAGFELFKGTTVFEPKRFALKATAVANSNFLSAGSLGFGDLESGDGKVGLEEAFVEARLAVHSPNFDFTSIRVGMQNLTTDFRGFVFSENQAGVRLFGNAKVNRLQYNLALFAMREREAASQLHGFGSRHQTVLVANLFVQDFAHAGYTTLFNLHLNRDDGPDGEQRPLRTTYVGWHGDGRLGTWNVSHAAYAVFGSDEANAFAGDVDVSAQMAALELSRDFDWLRVRLSALWASGDDDPADADAGGFDAISENPNFAGGAFMYWTQQGTTAGGGLLSDKFSLLPSLRDKFTGRANHVNPGLVLLGLGADLKLTPKLKVVLNASRLGYAASEFMSRLSGNPAVGSQIGWDLSAGFKWRPLLNENVTLVGGYAMLKPGDGLEALLDENATLSSGFLALTFTY